MPIRLRKIISGGQTGADQGGLSAAWELDIETGGFMPRGFRTELGKQPELARIYGVVEIHELGYKMRTELNVRNSDATLLFGNLVSPGSKLTRELAKAYKKHHFIKPFYDEREQDDGIDPDYIRNWLAKHQIEVLNVAGNRESRNPGIFRFTKMFLIETLRGRI